MLSFSVIIALAICTALAAVLMLSRFGGFRLVLRYAAAVDVVFTIALLFMFAGTITGMLVAVMGGLALSIMLTVCKTIVKWADHGLASMKPSHDPDSEYDQDGVWIYNKAPYV